MQQLDGPTETTPGPSSSSWLVFALALTCGFMAGCSRDARPAQAGTAKTKPVTRASGPPAPTDPATSPLPEFPTRVVRVRTAEPGFRVFVDGEPVHAPDGGFAVTPCAVTLVADAREVLVAKPGFPDSRMSLLSGGAEVIFDPVTPDESSEGILDAAYLESPVGEPIALESLNSSGAELDPFLAPDGLSIWFVGRRQEGTGIYVARRASRWQPFDPPEFLSVTAGLETPATPCLAGEGDVLVYGVPERRRIYSWRRAAADGAFADRRILQFGRDSELLWPSCQMLPDGLRLYWTEADPGGAKLRGQAAVRRSTEDPFSKPIDYPLPGLHPCLSADGRRQYVFDGTRLQRAWRADLRDRFSALETIATLDLPGYAPSKTRRQYVISADEQWIFYSDNAEQGGDLHMVRLFDRPHWGVAPVAEPIAPREAAAAAVVENPERPVEMPEPPPASPGTLGPIEWQPVGPRKWASPGPGEYVAAPGYTAGSYLRSSRELDNFELKLEWKSEGTFGQGGVFFRYPGQGDLYTNSFKVHLANDYGLVPDPQCTGSLFNYQAPEENAVRKPGEWNTLTLRARDESVEVRINGKTVLETVAVSDRIPSRGYIALDGLSGGIAYRQILLIELPPE
jgi:hypothetical protein